MTEYTNAESAWVKDTWTEESMCKNDNVIKLYVDLLPFHCHHTLNNPVELHDILTVTPRTASDTYYRNDHKFSDRYA